MAAGSNPMICEFPDQPRTRKYAESIGEFVRSLGPVTVERKAQESYAVTRKFLWLWAYERTADGTLYLSVLLDREVSDPHLHDVTRVSAHRWNHSVVVTSAAEARSGWLHDLLRAGYAFASG